MTMETPISRWQTFWILICCTWLNSSLCLGANDESSVTLTPNEQAWVASHPTIRLYVPRDAPPLIMKTDPVTGEMVDIHRLIEKASGIKMELIALPAAEGVKQAISGELDGAFPTVKGVPTLTKHLIQSEVILSSFCYAFVRPNDPIPIDNLKDLVGIRVGYLAGVYHLKHLLESQPGIREMSFTSAEQLIAALVEGEVDVILGNVDMHYRMTNMLVQVELAHVFSDRPVDVVYSIRKDWPELISIINKAIAAIPAVDLYTVQAHWQMNMPKPQQHQRALALSREEKLWLEKHHTIRVASDPDWSPIETLNADGTRSGIAIDYLTIIGRRLGVTFEYANSKNWNELLKMGQNKQVDVFSGLSPTKSRKQHLLFTKPYLSIPIKLYAAEGIDFVSDISEMYDYRVSVIKGYATEAYLRQNYPHLTYITVASVQEGLASLGQGKADIYAGDHFSTSHAIAKNDFTDIRVVGDTPYQFDVSLAVRDDWPELVNILQKTMESIPQTKRDAIYAKNVPVLIRTPADYSLIWRIIGALIVIVVISLLWSGSLKRQVNTRTAELADSEARYRLLAEQSMDMIAIKDRDKKYIYASPASAHLFGYTMEELQGRNCLDFVYPEDRDILEKAFETLKSTREMFSMEYRLVHKNGTVVWVEMNCEEINRQTGQILSNTRNISQRKEAEEQLRSSEEKLQQSQKLNALGQLAGGIAHDFNNMLGGIIGYADLARETVQEDSPVKKYLDHVLAAAERATKLSGQILAFSRRRTEEKEKANVAELVDEVVSLLKASIPTSVKIQTSVSESIPLVLLEPTKIHEVLMNLATNAVHAMDEKGELQIHALMEEVTSPVDAQFGLLAPGTYVKLVVADDGCGMSKDSISQAFEPFFTTKAKGKGTGLGLAMVHNTVLSHGGDLCVTSEKGKGTRFDIYLPCCEAPVDRRVLETAKLKGGQEHILIVDDEPMLVEMNARVLRQLGYEVTECTSSVQAMEILEKDISRFDLLLSDFTMPEHNGLELAQTARRHRDDLPVIICSGYLTQENAQKIAEAGIESVCAKPVRQQELAIMIRKELDKSEGRA